MEDWTHTTSLTILRIIEAPYRKKESELLCIYIRDVDCAYCDIFCFAFYYLLRERNYYRTMIGYCGNLVVLFKCGLILLSLSICFYFCVNNTPFD